ncbi:MAG: DUF3168 domain-containing protein [Cohnella sp.]|nr:DUF3168 domain-containing protein [Cohnella sp.]
MIDMKPTITAALRGNTALVTLLGGAKVYPEVSPDGTTLPYVTFFEITNFEANNADDVEIESEIHFQVDIWSKGNTGPPTAAVVEAMGELGFRRAGAADQYEKETKTYHKILRFKTTTEV